ncbi:hypothetical protein AB4304_13900 [Vibrio breoganii]
MTQLVKQSNGNTTKLVADQEGYGALFMNDGWTQGSKQPKFSGQVNVDGKIVRVALWPKQAKSGKWFLSAVAEELELVGDEPTQIFTPAKEPTDCPF